MMFHFFIVHLIQPININYFFQKINKCLKLKLKLIVLYYWTNHKNVNNKREIFFFEKNIFFYYSLFSSKKEL